MNCSQKEHENKYNHFLTILESEEVMEQDLKDIRTCKTFKAFLMSPLLNLTTAANPLSVTSILPKIRGH